MRRGYLHGHPLQPHVLVSLSIASLAGKVRLCLPLLYSDGSEHLLSTHEVVWQDKVTSAAVLEILIAGSGTVTEHFGFVCSGKCHLTYMYEKAEA